jgi:hypothetical protein
MIRDKINSSGNWKDDQAECYASKLFCGKLERQAGILPERYYHISGGNVNKMVCGSGN